MHGSRAVTPRAANFPLLSTRPVMPCLLACKYASMQTIMQACLSMQGVEVAGRTLSSHKVSPSSSSNSRGWPKFPTIRGKSVFFGKNEKTTTEKQRKNNKKQYTDARCSILHHSISVAYPPPQQSVVKITASNSRCCSAETKRDPHHHRKIHRNIKNTHENKLQP